MVVVMVVVAAAAGNTYFDLLLPGRQFDNSKASSSQDGEAFLFDKPKGYCSMTPIL